MAKSEIIQRLIENEIKLSDALYRVLVISTELGNEKVSEWVKSELNGYETIDILPSYRKTISTNLTYSGINGRYQITNSPLDLTYLTAETIELIKDVADNDPITSVEHKLTQDGELFQRDLTHLAGEVYRNTNDGYIGLQCTRISQVVPKQFYHKIYTEVKTKLVEILLMLEEELGSLDKKDIKLKKRKEKYRVLNSRLSNILDKEVVIIEKEKSKLLYYILIPIGVVVIGGVILSLVQGWLSL